MIKRALTLIFILLASCSQPVFGDIFTVTNTLDSGPGSLRQAIIDSNNASSTPNQINFNIPGSGPRVIIPKSDLPDITNPLTINGYTQPGSKPASEKWPATILIEIQGLFTSTAGLNLAEGSDHSTIKGLAINLCPFDPAIQLLSGFNVIEGNYIGTDASGEVTLPSFNGIQILSSNNRVGGNTPAQRNVLGGTNQLSTDSAGNGRIVQAGNCILIAGDQNRIQGNYIGINKDGECPIEFTDIGVFIRTGDGNLIGGACSEGNVISGNVFIGILVGYNRPNPLPITNTRIVGNWIGTNAAGDKCVGNGDGIALFQDSSNTFISGNVISGNTVHGINIASHWQGLSIDTSGGSNSPVAGPTLIKGNIIGLDATGHHSLGNLFDGIFLGEATSGTLIGGSEKDAGNVISGNQRNGIFIQSFANHNTVEGNEIVRNGRYGIQIGSLMAPGNDNVIGGTSKRAGNVIFDNEKGDLFIDANSLNNRVLCNQIGKNKSNH